ncbi:MAG TPA: hypothetical protein VFE05_14935, partial [Longimicrobiaceae bacterium]|nr:hypothetical protein [Longimicrobiaceae bacterium]
MSNFWIVRAGEGGYLAPAFDKAGVVGMGWRGAGDFTHLREIDEFKERVAADPDVKTGAIPNSASMAYKFRHVIAKGDDIVTYDPARREYLVGTVVSDYEYRKDVLPDYDHLRHVQWKGRVSRDALTPSSRNRLGSTLSLFQPGDEVWQEIQTVLQSGA